MQALAANALVRCAFAGEYTWHEAAPFPLCWDTNELYYYHIILYYKNLLLTMLSLAAFPLFGTLMYEKLGDQVSGLIGR